MPPQLRTVDCSPVMMEERKNQEWIRVYDLENHFIGIFCFDKNRKKLTVEKMFLDQEEIRG